MAQFVADQPEPPTENQVTALAVLLRRREETIKSLIRVAKDKFLESAERYVDIHREATEGALIKEDFEQARMGAQWAIENIGANGARIVDKQTDVPAGVQVLVGVRVGGLNDAKSDLEPVSE